MHLRTETANRCSISAKSTSGPSDDPAIITHHPRAGPIEDVAGCLPSWSR